MSADWHETTHWHGPMALWQRAVFRLLQHENSNRKTVMNADMRLQAIRERVDAATPGPWGAGDVWVFTRPVYDDDNRLSNVLGMKFADEDRADAERQRGLTNAEFIAAAREDVPWLLEILRTAELRAAEAAWDACLDAIKENELNTQQAREGNPYRARNRNDEA